ncbi:GRIP and coiled-coil domain-containing protein 1-like [Rhopilema esculentum]|uniref:GRIP and coiled-coil domain-containing protein 1-like n=1 Tax=Rhopilema esculentum TaxID=499914 RepID=UPI0031E0260E
MLESTRYRIVIEAVAQQKWQLARHVGKGTFENHFKNIFYNSRMFRSVKGNDKKLLEKIEEQEQKILRYETRLRDVVQAYKSLQNEKEALESTVKALSFKPSQESKKKGKRNEESRYTDPLIVRDLTTDKNDSTDTESIADESREDISQSECKHDDCEENEGDESYHLHEKISTLSKALATVTQEKSKMEAAFQTDKKMAIQEHEKRLRESEEQIEILQEKNAELIESIQELKTRLRKQQSELQTEQENNAVMLKEMQQLVSVERLEKEELKIRLQERRETDTKFSSKKAYETKIQELSDELANVSVKLKQFETDTSQPSGLLLQISDEMIALKKYHSDALRKEQTRANEAEDALKRFSLMEEERIAQLETKLAELSDVVSSYEKLRYQDQQVIQKLKERLSHIDLTSSTTQQRVSSPEIEKLDRNNQISDMKEQILKLKGLLKLAWNSKDVCNDNIDTDPITAAELDNILHNDPAHRACQLEYKQLKDEFENYKREIKKSNVLHENATLDNQELEIAKQNYKELEKELKKLNMFFEDKERDYIDTVSNLQCDLTEIGEKHKAEVDKIHDAYKLEITNLETQIVKQRERTLQLLEDRDTEIRRLKGCDLASPVERKRLEISNDYEKMASGVSLADPENAVKRSVETEVAVTQLLTRQNSAGSEGTMVYYLQKMTNLQTEIANLRNQNSELESSLREEEHREEQFVEQMKSLKEEIRRLERNRTRETANMEYVKNIFLRYILSDSQSVKLQLTTAIATVLQFSPSELNSLRKKQNGWWPSNS